MINLVLDSSAVAKWFFPEEQSNVALKIREDFLTKKITISAPTLIFYEVNNILKTAVKSLRIEKEKAINAAFEGLPLADIIVSEMLNSAIKTNPSERMPSVLPASKNFCP